MNSEPDPPSDPGDPVDDDSKQDSDSDGEAEGPLMFDDPAYSALREGDCVRFQELTQGMDVVDYSFANLGGVDLRKVEMGRMIIQGARLKGADLRGLDLSGHDLDGVSLNNARISGVLFPRNLAADEILMSVEHGTRIRHNVDDEDATD